MTLTDHINSAVARYREGIALKNMMKIDIRKFYPKEYQVGMHAIEWIKEQTGEDLGDDEAAFYCNAYRVCRIKCTEYNRCESDYRVDQYSLTDCKDSF